MRDTFRVEPIEINTIPYRGAVTSDDLNHKFNRLRTAILRTLLRAKNTRERAQELVLATAYTNALQTVQQQALLGQINAMRTSGSPKTIHTSFYGEKDGTTPADVGVNRDRLYGQLSLETSKTWRKIPTYLDEFGDIRPVDSVVVYQDGAALERKHSLYWTLNGTSDRFWIDNTADLGQDTIIRVTMPPGLRNEINNISIIPFPIGACRIMSVEYKGPGGYIVPPGFFESLNPVKLHFAPSMFQDEIRLRLRSTTIRLGGVNQSLWGIGNIDLSLTDYTSEGVAFSSIKALGTDTFSRITKFNADYSIDSGIPVNLHDNPPVKFTVMKVDGTVIYNSSSDPFPLGDGDTPITISGSPTTLWLRTDLKEPIDRVSPVVKGATLTYE
jgi:type II secretory pathway pseudopilin PulG